MSDATDEKATKKGQSASKGRATPKAKGRDEAVHAAYYRAKMQWYAIGTVLVIAVIAAIVLLSIMTEGDLGGGGSHS